MKSKRNISLLLTLLVTSLCAWAQSGFVINMKNGQKLKFENASVQSLTFDEATVPPVTGEPKIGDYYYSDGTWSTELDNTKTPIAIVFYVGNPSADDEGLRNEHPECTHGLAIALNETMSSWQEKYETYGSNRTVSDWLTANGYPAVKSTKDDDAPVNKMVGYTYSKYLKAFNASPDNAEWPITSMMAVDDYSAAVPAPASSSGWFLGSGREMVLACFGKIEGNITSMGRQDPNMRDLLNIKLASLPQTDATLFDTTGQTYWTCNEYGVETEGLWIDRAWGVYFMRDRTAVSGSMKNWSEYARVRPILAF